MKMFLVVIILIATIIVTYREGQKGFGDFMFALICGILMLLAVGQLP